MGYTQLEVEQWFINKGSKFIGVYKNSVSPIQYQCVKCGFIATYNSFNKIKYNNHNCICGECNRTAANEAKKVAGGLDEKKAWFRVQGSELIKYQNAKSEIQFKCVKCGKEEVYSNIGNLMEKNSHCWCKVCNKEATDEAKRTPEAEVKQWFLDRGSELIEYNGYGEIIKYQCVQCKGVAEYNSFYRLKQHSEQKCICKDCSRAGEAEKKMIPQEEVRVWFAARGSTLIGLYNGVSESIQFKCSHCGKIETNYSWNDLKINNIRCWCKSCNMERIKNLYRKDEHIVRAWFTARGSIYLNKIYVDNKSPVLFKCTRCGGNGEYKAGLWFMQRDNPECLCNKCRNELNRGKTHPSWRHDLTQEEREQDRRTVEGHNIWHNQILNKSEYKCLISGNNIELQAHHLMGWAQHPQLRTMIWNGVCLSKDLHNEFHNKYGRGNNDFKQFQDFYQEKIGQQFYLIDQPNIKVDLIYPENIVGNNDKNLRNKKASFAEEGINYVPVFLWEVLSKPNIVDSMVGHRVGSNLITVGARKLNIINITVGQSRTFFEENHKQGHLNGSINLALTDGNIILSVMNFAKSRNPVYQWELERFASKIGYRVPGAASRLFKNFVENQQPTSIKTYADLRYSNWDFEKTVYAKLGFTPLHKSEPNYFYSKDGVGMFSRVQFQKHRLAMVLDKFDPDLTEKENMADNGYQIYHDCGNHVAVWKE